MMEVDSMQALSSMELTITPFIIGTLFVVLVIHVFTITSLDSSTTTMDNTLHFGIEYVEPISFQ